VQAFFITKKKNIYIPETPWQLRSPQPFISNHRASSFIFDESLAVCFGFPDVSSRRHLPPHVSSIRRSCSWTNLLFSLGIWIFAEFCGQVTTRHSPALFGQLLSKATRRAQLSSWLSYIRSRTLPHTVLLSIIANHRVPACQLLAT
jgi:hypothetical protein